MTQRAEEAGGVYRSNSDRIARFDFFKQTPVLKVIGMTFDTYKP